jgi:hypothetical protein
LRLAIHIFSCSDFRDFSFPFGISLDTKQVEGWLAALHLDFVFAPACFMACLPDHESGWNATGSRNSGCRFVVTLDESCLAYGW